MNRLLFRILASLVLWIGTLTLVGVLSGYGRLAAERSGTTGTENGNVPGPEGTFRDTQRNPYRSRTPSEARTISIVLFLMSAGILTGAVKASWEIWKRSPLERFR